MRNATMKITLFIALVFLSLAGYCQNELGQNKKFIVDKNSDCIVDRDTDDMMIFNCDGSTVFYGFTNYGLCNFVGIDFPKSFYNESIEMLLDANYEIIIRGTAPILLSLKAGNVNSTSPAITYTNYEIIATVLEYDLVGDDSSEFFGVYFENYDDVEK